MQLWGVAVLATVLTLALWLLHRHNLLYTSCQLSPADIMVPNQAQEGAKATIHKRVIGGINTYTSLVSKYLQHFFGLYELSLIKGKYDATHLSAMAKCARKVEKYMYELEFRRCNDVVATERHMASLHNLLRALEAYAADAAERHQLPYQVRIL